MRRATTTISAAAHKKECEKVPILTGQDNNQRTQCKAERAGRMEDKVTERALTNQTKTTKRNLPREMLTAPNYKIKCETKMDCVKQCRE